MANRLPLWQRQFYFTGYGEFCQMQISAFRIASAGLQSAPYPGDFWRNHALFELITEK
jgi:hypothetical protein